MKIVLTVNLAWNLAHFRKPLIDAFVAEGHEVIALCPHDETVQQLEGMGCRTVNLKMDNKGLSPTRDLRLLARLWRHFRRERPDVILGFTIKNNIYGSIAARILGIPFIPNVTGLGTAFLSGGLLERLAIGLYRFAFRPLPHVMFQNPDDRDLFIERGIVTSGQAILLPGSGIDLERFAAQPAPAPREELVFLMISRLLRDKGVLEYVEAARQLKANGVKARFQILGAIGADNRTAIDADTVDGWVREGVIEYIGTTRDVRPAIAAADCVVLPSYREGTPRTLLEGSAMAKPCVTTDVPGCRNVVHDGVTGLLCKVRDAADLARAMAQMAAMEPEDRHAMGLAGRDRMEQQFDQAKVIGAYRTAIAQVTSGLAPHTDPDIDAAQIASGECPGFAEGSEPWKGPDLKRDQH